MADNQVPNYYLGPITQPVEASPEVVKPTFYTGPIAPPSPREQEVTSIPVTGSEAFSRGYDQGMVFNRGPQYKALATASGFPTEPTMMGNPEPIAAMVGAAKVGAQKMLPNVFGTSALEKYRTELPIQQERYKQTEEAYPKTTMGGSLAGSLANPVVMALTPEVKGGQLLYGGFKGAASGAGLGAAYGSGIGETPEEQLKHAGWGALSGAVIGGPLGVLGEKFGASIPMGPASQEVRKAAEQLGIPISIAATTESPTARGLTNLVKDIPLAGTPIRESAQETVSQLRSKAEQLSGGIEKYGAGRQIEEGIFNWQEASKLANSDAYKAVDDLVDPSVTQPLTNTVKIAQDIASKRKAGRLPNELGAVREVFNAITDPNGLTYEGIKTARTNIGQLMKSSNLPADVSQAELKRLYGSLTEDLKAAVEKGGGPDALKAFNAADQQYQQFINNNEQIMKFLGVRPDAKSPEQVFNAVLASAKDGAKADINNLLRAKDMLPPTAWEKLGQGAVNKLGFNPAGDFDPNLFVRNWASFSDAGKDALFGAAGTGSLRDSLDAISTVSKNMERLSLLSAPPDAAAKGSFFVASILNPISTLTAGTSGRIAAELLSRPATAKATGAWAKAYQNYVQSGASEAATKLLGQSTRNLAAVSGGEIEPEQLLKATIASYNTLHSIYNYYGGQRAQDTAERALETGQATGGRVGRKSGGRTLNSISSEVEHTRALLSNKTASMLSMPDDAIVTALNIAKKK